jgi:hypothetical protein
VDANMLKNGQFTTITAKISLLLLRNRGQPGMGADKKTSGNHQAERL